MPPRPGRWVILSPAFSCPALLVVFFFSFPPPMFCTLFCCFVRTSPCVFRAFFWLLSRTRYFLLFTEYFDTFFLCLFIYFVHIYIFCTFCLFQDLLFACFSYFCCCLFIYFFELFCVFCTLFYHTLFSALFLLLSRCFCTFFSFLVLVISPSHGLVSPPPLSPLPFSSCLSHRLISFSCLAI